MTRTILIAVYVTIPDNDPRDNEQLVDTIASVSYDALVKDGLPDSWKQIVVDIPTDEVSIVDEFSSTEA